MSNQYNLKYVIVAENKVALLLEATTKAITRGSRLKSLGPRVKIHVLEGPVLSHYQHGRLRS